MITVQRMTKKGIRNFSALNRNFSQKRSFWNLLREIFSLPPNSVSVLRPMIFIKCVDECKHVTSAWLALFYRFHSISITIRLFSEHQSIPADKTHSGLATSLDSLVTDASRWGREAMGTITFFPFSSAICQFNCSLSVSSSVSESSFVLSIQRGLDWTFCFLFFRFLHVV